MTDFESVTAAFVFAGRHGFDAAEEIVQARRARKSGIPGYVQDAPRVFEQRLRVFDPQALNEAFRSGSRPLFEEPFEVERAQVRAGRDVAQRRLVSIVSFDEVDAGLDALEVE
jgi:hypothetical protein